jgi:hypothetical protein
MAGGRPRVYGSDAERVRAFRQRKREEEERRDRDLQEAKRREENRVRAVFAEILGELLAELRDSDDPERRTLAEALDARSVGVLHEFLYRHGLSAGFVTWRSAEIAGRIA